jgi:hypothetical protein
MLIEKAQNDGLIWRIRNFQSVSKGCRTIQKFCKIEDQRPCKTDLSRSWTCSILKGELILISNTQEKNISKNAHVKGLRGFKFMNILDKFEPSQT